MMKRLTVYIHDHILRRLKSILALRGLSVSEWVRQKAHEEVSENIDKTLLEE
jgi:hypothetical protein